jgi:hypothetical protein
MSSRTVRPSDKFGPELPDMAGNECRILDPLDFQFFSASSCPESMVREITSFLDTQDTSHPFQFPQWSGRGAHLALLREKGQIRWFAQCGVFYPAGRILRPIRALTVNRGPVADDLGLMEAGLRRLVEEGRRKGYAFIDIAPEWAGAFGESAGSLLERTGWQALPGTRSSLRLDLSPDLNRLLGDFRKVTRYEIRRSERQEVEVRMARNGSDAEDFLRLYVGMAAEKQFAAEDLEHFRHLLHWLAADTGRGGLLLALKDGKQLGGAVIVRSGKRCWYVLGATAKDNAFSAGHLLQWRAIQWARETSCREYDFGGYREGATSGPAFFKSGFCDNVVRFLPPHRYTISRTLVGVCGLGSRFRHSFRKPKGKPEC